MAVNLSFANASLRLDSSGALWWAAQRALIVADLHLEKGSAFARRGSLQPPYDSHATLERLEGLVDRLRPNIVVSLGDGFHERHSCSELSPDLYNRLCALTRPRRWIWVTGNHDPVVPLSLGGAAVPELAVGDLVLRHAPTGGAGEIAGHLHPKARLFTRRRHLFLRCFAADADRMLLPALGSFTGGLNVLDRAILRLFPAG